MSTDSPTPTGSPVGATETPAAEASTGAESKGWAIPTRASGAASPIIQLCVDVFDTKEALEVAHMGLRAGVDWLEMGTPMVSWVGITGLKDFLDDFLDRVTFLDAKVMDGSWPYVYAAGELGVELVSVCASASDATFRAGLAETEASGVKIVADLYAVADPVRRGLELADLGVHALYLHYGWDELAEDRAADPTLAQLEQLRAATSVPLGIVTSSTEMAEDAVRAGADILLVGHPFLNGPTAETDLHDYVQRVRSAATSA